MMRLKIEIIGNGLHPNEAVVGIRTNEGSQRLVVARRSIDDGNFISVGWPLGHQNTSSLVELPRETQTGAWRVWVPDDQLVESDERKRA